MARDRLSQKKSWLPFLPAATSRRSRPAPKCRMPAPAAAETCPECGWDMREAYHPEPVQPHTS